MYVWRFKESTTTSVMALPKHTRNCSDPETIPDSALRHHAHGDVGPYRCSAVVVQRIRAPAHAVWALVRRFDRPHEYKHFLRSCHVISGLGDPCRVGALREVRVVSGLPACTSVERLDVLDDGEMVAGFSVVGGDHRLRNYRSVTTVHEAGTRGESLVVESYEVDVPEGNTMEETRAFVDTIVRCNLQSLANIAEK